MEQPDLPPTHPPSSYFFFPAYESHFTPSEGPTNSTKPEGLNRMIAREGRKKNLKAHLFLAPGAPSSPHRDRSRLKAETEQILQYLSETTRGSNEHGSRHNPSPPASSSSSSASSSSSSSNFGSNQPEFKGANLFTKWWRAS